MATKKNVKLSVGRGEKLPVTIDDFTFPLVENYFIGKENQIYSEHTKSGLWYIYGHFQADTKELFYIGLGKYNRCNQINQRNNYWRRIKNKHGLIIRLFEVNLSLEDAKKKEIYYIKKYWPKANMTTGGEAGNCENLRIRVHAYNKDGTHYMTFDSMVEANIFLNQKENDSRISRCLKGDRLSFAGYIWKDKYEEKINPYIKKDPYNSRSVYRYSIDGIFLEKLNKIADFKEGSRTGICNCLDKDYTFFGSFWRSYYAEKINVIIVTPALKKPKMVIDSKFGIIYESVTKAAKTIGCCRSVLERKLNGTRRNNTNFVYYEQECKV
jgi:hypothetical protein